MKATAIFSRSTYVEKEIKKVRIYLNRHSSQVVLLLIAAVILIHLYRFMAYEWLFILPISALVFAIYFLAVFLLGIKGQVAIMAALLIFVFCLLALLVGNQSFAEEASILAFYFLSLGMIQMLWEIRKND